MTLPSPVHPLLDSFRSWADILIVPDGIEKVNMGDREPLQGRSLVCCTDGAQDRLKKDFKRSFPQIEPNWRFVQSVAHDYRWGILHEQMELYIDQFRDPGARAKQWGREVTECIVSADRTLEEHPEQAHPIGTLYIDKLNSYFPLVLRVPANPSADETKQFAQVQKALRQSIVDTGHKTVPLMIYEDGKCTILMQSTVARAFMNHVGARALPTMQLSLIGEHEDDRHLEGIPAKRVTLAGKVHTGPIRKAITSLLP